MTVKTLRKLFFWHRTGCWQTLICSCTNGDNGRHDDSNCWQNNSPLRMTTDISLCLSVPIPNHLTFSSVLASFFFFFPVFFGFTSSPSSAASCCGGYFTLANQTDSNLTTFLDCLSVRKSAALGPSDAALSHVAHCGLHSWVLLCSSTCCLWIATLNLVTSLWLAPCRAWFIEKCKKRHLCSLGCRPCSVRCGILLLRWDSVVQHPNCSATKSVLKWDPHSWLTHWTGAPQCHGNKRILSRTSLNCCISVRSFLSSQFSLHKHSKGLWLFLWPENTPSLQLVATAIDVSWQVQANAVAGWPGTVWHICSSDLCHNCKQADSQWDIGGTIWHGFVVANFGACVLRAKSAPRLCMEGVSRPACAG